MTTNNAPFAAAIASALLPGEIARMEIAVREDRKVRVTVLPMRLAGHDDAPSDPTIAQLRASLALPIQVVSEADHIDAELYKHLTEYRGVRQKVNSTLEQLQEALKAGQSASTKAVTTKQDAHKAAETAPPAASDPNTEDDNSNPDSL